jgi:hypothetical protein
MTQIEEIKEAIKHLDLAIDTFPDKDNEIRAYNDMIDGIVATLKYIIKDFSRYE